MANSPERIAKWARWYRRALWLYPAAHRREYADAMVQHFRDQLRGLGAMGGGGLGRFLFRTLIDFAGNCVREHRQSLREKLTMKSGKAGWLAAVSGGFAAVLILGAVVAVTAHLPRTFLSTARLKLFPDDGRWMAATFDPFQLQTQAEILRSPEVLGKVADQLKLAERWGVESAAGMLNPSETFLRLRQRVEVRQYRNTTMVEVRAFDSDPALAADIANTVTEVYLEYTKRGKAAASPEGGQVMGAVVTDPAEPGLRPVRPNVPLNLFVGILVAGAFGLLIAGGAWFLLHRRSAPPVITG